MTTTNLILLTSGPKLADAQQHAASVGINIKPGLRFLRQQDWKASFGQQALPRIWEGKKQDGTPDRAVINGGVPGLHDHTKVKDGAGRNNYSSAILDFEPENWLKHFKTGTRRQVIDGLDVIRTGVNGAGGLAFTFYPEMFWHIIDAAGYQGLDFFNELPFACCDGYLYDGKTDGSVNGAWGRARYRDQMQRWINCYARHRPSREILPFLCPCTSGEWREMTDPECEMVGSVWDELGILRRAVWVPCDNDADIANVKKWLTKDRVKMLSGEMGGAA
jgi:hypothetical protein